jgi:signal transduction histidine kinase/DNA-binding response OmpR family regulator
VTEMKSLYEHMILVVDDKAENILPLKKYLEHHKFQVDTALTGEDALKKVLKQEYAVIILDVQMPGMDGFEVAEALSGHKNAKDSAIIFLSAVNTEKKFITQGYKTGGVDYITKPVDPDILILKVKNFYRLYHQTKELNRIQQALIEEVEFRKQAQSELRETAKKLWSILESIPQLAFMTDKDGRIQYTNQQRQEYSGSADGHPDMHIDDLEKMIGKWEEARKNGVSLEMEVRIRKLFDENFRCHLLRIIPVRENEEIKMWVGTYTDIEEQKRAERKKDEFMSIASHELKTPLTSIKAYFQLLERGVKENTLHDIGRYVKKASDQLDKLHTLISDLLDVSKIESGKLQYQKNNFEFDPLVANVIDTIQATNSDKRIVWNGPAKVHIHGDAARIEQVLVNYLTNAIKYSPGASEVHVNTKLINGREIEVRVKDFGIGIPPEKLPNVFSKFYRVEESASRFQGLGIGLYICAEVIRNHNGVYGVESEPGKGSEFYFKLPVIK